MQAYRVNKTEVHPGKAAQGCPYKLYLSSV